MILKVNPARTIFAVKTNLPAPREWGYMSVDQGGGYCTEAEMVDWDDIEVPERKQE